ncbi:MAG: dipeptidase PepE [Acidobacteriota bacterium]
MKHLLLISSSNVYGYGYLDHSEPEIKRTVSAGTRVLFVPFALRDEEAYTAKVRERLALMGLSVTALKSEAELASADAIFVGGGNTWRLLKRLYERKLLQPIRDAVERGLPYIGSSAGSNIAAPTIRTTNDMPIMEVPSMDALGLVPFQINPHYLDPELDSTHMGETREQRIMEFLEENTAPVVGLREGTMLQVENGLTTLLGIKHARLFRRGQPPLEVEPGSILDL